MAADQSATDMSRRGAAPRGGSDVSRGASGAVQFPAAAAAASSACSDCGGTHAAAAVAAGTPPPPAPAARGAGEPTNRRTAGPPAVSDAAALLGRGGSSGARCGRGGRTDRSSIVDVRPLCAAAEALAGAGPHARAHAAATRDVILKRL
jgi:hypothetical protein